MKKISYLSVFTVLFFLHYPCSVNAVSWNILRGLFGCLGVGAGTHEVYTNKNEISPNECREGGAVLYSNFLGQECTTINAKTPINAKKDTGNDKKVSRASFTRGGYDQIL